MSDNTHERYDIPNADILSVDVWAEDAVSDSLVCAECGAPLRSGVLVCDSCRTPVPACTGSCSSCGPPVCVGDKRP